MKWMQWYILSIAITCMSPLANSEGTDFLLAYEDSLTTSSLTLYIYAEQDTNGSVSIPAISFSQSFNYVKGSVVAITIPVTALIASSGTVSDMAINVQSSRPVVVTAFVSDADSADAYNVEPIIGLGMEYFIVSTEAVGSTSFPSQFQIVATQDNTNITITPSSTNDLNLTVNISTNIVLNADDVYQLQASAGGEDLTGTVIGSDKPIAVFSGHYATDIPIGSNFADHLAVQLADNSKLAMEYYIAPFATRTTTKYRVLATQNSTSITTPSGGSLNLNAGEFASIDITTGTYWSADKPIMLMQLMESGDVDGVTSADPSMVNVLPINRWGSRYMVHAPASVASVHYINIVALCSDLETITVDSQIVLVGKSVTIGSSLYCYAQHQITAGIHTLNGNGTFSVVVYGFGAIGDYVSYAYTGAQTTKITPSISPQTSSGGSISKISILIFLLFLIFMRYIQGRKRGNICSS